MNNNIYNQKEYVYCVLGTYDDNPGDDIMFGVYSSEELADEKIKLLEQDYPTFEFYRSVYILNEGV